MALLVHGARVQDANFVFLVHTSIEATAPNCFRAPDDPIAAQRDVGSQRPSIFSQAIMGMNREANPRKAAKPTMSVTVVRKMAAD